MGLPGTPRWVARSGRAGYLGSGTSGCSPGPGSCPRPNAHPIATVGDVTPLSSPPPLPTHGFGKGCHPDQASFQLGWGIHSFFMQTSCVRLFPSVRKELGGLGSLQCNMHLSAGQCSLISTGNAGIFLKGVNTVISGKQKTEKALLRERTNRMHNCNHAS